jgi:metal-dependent amidase/aminoacylase/carboxypeptidase family protein
MAAESYGALKAMVKEEAGDRPYIWSVGVFQGGEVHNVIADLCTQYISFRFYDEEFAERVHKRTVEITEEIAARYGGRIEVLWHMSCPPVNNDAALVAHLEKVAAMLPGVELIEMPAKRSSEDFSWFTAQRPGMLFRYGIHNEAKGCVAAAHRPDFMVDEDTMQLAALAFVNFAMTYGK